MKTKTTLLLSLVILGLAVTTLHAQVAINNTAASPDASAILDLNTGNAGVNKGFLPPQVALTSINAAAPVTNPATGLMVYSTTAPVGGSGTGYYYWNGTSWISFISVDIDSLSGSGTTNYVARWTPNGTTLGIGLIQDNNTSVGINGAPVAGTMLTVVGGPSNNGINGTSTNTTPGTYGVHGLAHAGLDGYLSYVGPIVAGGYTDTNAAGYMTSNSAKGGALIATTTGSSTLPAIQGLSNVWHGGFFATTNAAASGAGGINNAVSGTSTGNGLTGVTSQSKGFAVEGQNTYKTAGVGVGVFGIGSGAAGNYFADGEGMMGDGTDYGIEGYEESPTGTGGGYFQDQEGDFAIIGDQGDQAGGGFADKNLDFGLIGDYTDQAGAYFQDASGDYAYLAYGGFGILASGAKSTIVKDGNNQDRIMFCDESPEVVFHDYGTAALSNGKVHVNLDPVFAQTVTINEKHPLRVMVTLNDQCNGVYVTNRTATGFDVVELNNGKSNASFTYEVIANRSDSKTYKGVARNYSDMRYPVGPGPRVLKNTTSLRLHKVNNTKLLLTPSITQR